MHIIHVGMFSLKKKNKNAIFKKEKMLFYFAPSTVVCNTDELFWCVCVCSQPLDSDPLPSDLLTAAVLSPASWGGGNNLHNGNNDSSSPGYLCSVSRVQIR